MFCILHMLLAFPRAPDFLLWGHLTNEPIFPQVLLLGSNWLGYQLLTLPTDFTVFQMCSDTKIKQQARRKAFYCNMFECCYHKQFLNWPIETEKYMDYSHIVKSPEVFNFHGNKILFKYIIRSLRNCSIILLSFLWGALALYSFEGELQYSSAFV